MPYTVEELKKNEFWQRLHEQDRVDYQKKLKDAVTFHDAPYVFDDNGNIIYLEPQVPIRNSAGTFIAFEDPDTGLNYERPDQYITVDKKSPKYHKGDLWNTVLDREIKELI
mgnify:CR=1 FL=1